MGQSSSGDRLAVNDVRLARHPSDKRIASDPLASLPDRRRAVATPGHVSVVINLDPRRAAADLLPRRFMPDPAAGDHRGEDQHDRNGHQDAAIHCVKYDPSIKASAPTYDAKVTPPRHRTWIVSAGSALIAVGLFVVGLYLWRMMGPTPCSPPQCVGTHLPPHHLHPTRAEAVWLVSTLFAFVAVGSVLAPESFRHLIGRGSIEEASQSGQIPGPLPRGPGPGPGPGGSGVPD